MLDLNLPNFITVGIIGVAFWVAFQWVTNWLGIDVSSWAA